MIPPLYPDAQIDMAYFKPFLARTDGRAIQNLTECVIQREKWQRWSRHRTQQNPWRMGSMMWRAILPWSMSGSDASSSGDRL